MLFRVMTVTLTLGDAIRYLVLSPLLQWTVGSYIFQGPKGETEKGEEKEESDLIAMLATRRRNVPTHTSQNIL